MSNVESGPAIRYVASRHLQRGQGAFGHASVICDMQNPRMEAYLRHTCRPTRAGTRTTQPCQCRWARPSIAKRPLMSSAQAWPMVILAPGQSKARTRHCLLCAALVAGSLNPAHTNVNTSASAYTAQVYIAKHSEALHHRRLHTTTTFCCAHTAGTPRSGLFSPWDPRTLYNINFALCTFDSFSFSLADTTDRHEPRNTLHD